MANFFSSSEEENFELISSWWNKYKYVAIFLLFIVISGILFFEYWTQSSQDQRHELAQEYHVFIESLDDTSQENKQNIRDFIERFTDTPYANMASLHLSKVYVENGDLIEASKELKNIIESTSSSWGNQYDPIESTARLRLAKILLSLAPIMLVKFSASLKSSSQSTSVFSSASSASGSVEIFIGGTEY